MNANFLEKTMKKAFSLVCVMLALSAGFARGALFANESVTVKDSSVVYQPVPGPAPVAGTSFGTELAYVGGAVVLAGAIAAIIVVTSNETRHSH